ncbi:TonB-dependent receptor [Croceibacterium sp. TMG7-5b_MA50]|uniref:TonB-dependent receptor plug domain-containing protein n=1 Tax=Croceibacterium sp. TMG7-5b_MA50 TaxID=3121290 RepID=UPI0032220BB5
MMIYRLLATACLPAVALGAIPAAAQETTGEAIVVTGTLIRGDAGGVAPVQVWRAEDLAAQGSPTLLEFTRLLPVSSGVLGDSAQFDSRSQFAEGSASVNLRGLGPQRTLVLLNGRRLAQSGSGNVPYVDVNLLPADALDRIEVLTDGGATTYGSDAIGGVVNFITRTDQQGFTASAAYRLIDGSDGDVNGALAWGGRIGPVRAFLSAGYQRRSELMAGDRRAVLRPFAENPQGGWTGGGNPGNFDWDGPLNGTAFTADEGCEGLGGFRSLPGSNADLCSTNFLGFTNVVEPEERYQLFADLSLDLGPAAELRLTGLYGRTTTTLATSPSFLPTVAPSGNAAFGGGGLFVIPAYAPTLQDYCARFGAAAGCAPGQPALAFPVRFRPLLSGGNPLYDNARHTAKQPRDADMYQASAELGWQVGRDLRLTASATYSEYDRRFAVGDSFVDLLQNALAGFGGPDCAYASPASRAGLSAGQLAEIAGTRGCSYFNPFSTAIAANTVTSVANPNFGGVALSNDIATIDQIYDLSWRVANTQAFVADVMLAGSAGIALPGGEVEFAAGAQFRRDRYARRYTGGNSLDLYPCPGSVLDPAATCAVETGALGFIGSNRDIAAADKVWAGFAEARLPVLPDVQVQLSARYERYGTSGGDTFDPQARVRWEMLPGVAIRAGIGSTFRAAPPQSRLVDQVALTLIGSALRAVDVRGDPALAPESATTWSTGVDIARGGFTATVGYWRYDVSGAIEAEPVAGIVNALFGGSGTANCSNPAYAALQARFTFSGGQCGINNVQRLSTRAINTGAIDTSGIDASAAYTFAISNRWQMEAGGTGTYTFEYQVDALSVEGVAVQPAFDAAGQLNFQTTAYPLPQLKGSAWLQGMHEGRSGGHLLRLQVNHIAGYDDARGAAIFGPNTASLAGQSVTAGKRIKPWTTVDAIWRWTLPTKQGDTVLSLAVVNLADSMPPLARIDQNFDPFTHNALGRTVKLGVAQAF